MFLNSLLSGTNEGLIWAMLALGVFISFRVLDFADLTVEGSFTCGAAVTSVLIAKSGLNPFLATFIAFLIGAVAGFSTGVLHTKFKIAPILAGILTMIALYSINLRIMGSPSIGIGNFDTMFIMIQGWIGWPRKYIVLALSALLVAIIVGAIYWFFGTEIGCGIRATGTNAKMSRAQGINTDRSKIIGLMFSNALVALSGSVFAQYQASADVQMGIGTIVIGLASVIIGETIFFRARSFISKLVSIVCGSIIYRVIITFVISAEAIKPSDLKLFTAIIVALALSIPTIKIFFTHGHKRLMEHDWYAKSIGKFFIQIGAWWKKMFKKKKTAELCANTNGKNVSADLIEPANVDKLSVSEDFHGSDKEEK